MVLCKKKQQLFYLQENKGCDDIIGHVKIIANARPIQGKPFKWKHNLQRETHTQKARQGRLCHPLIIGGLSVADFSQAWL